MSYFQISLVIYESTMQYAPKKNGANLSPFVGKYSTMFDLLRATKWRFTFEIENYLDLFPLFKKNHFFKKRVKIPREQAVASSTYKHVLPLTIIKSGHIDR